MRFDDKKAVYCFGMSKMTVVSEQDHWKRYNELRFVEFLEMIGRIAEMKFAGTAMMDLSLSKRIEYVLDDIFGPILNKRRNNVSLVEVEESESDDDY